MSYKIFNIILGRETIEHRNSTYQLFRYIQIDSDGDIVFRETQNKNEYQPTNLHQHMTAKALIDFFNALQKTFDKQFNPAEGGLLYVQQMAVMNDTPIQFTKDTRTRYIGIRNFLQQIKKSGELLHPQIAVQMFNHFKLIPLCINIYGQAYQTREDHLEELIQFGICGFLKSFHYLYHSMNKEYASDLMYNTGTEDLEKKFMYAFLHKRRNKIDENLLEIQPQDKIIEEEKKRVDMVLHSFIVDFFKAIFFEILYDPMIDTSSGYGKYIKERIGWFVKAKPKFQNVSYWLAKDQAINWFLKETGNLTKAQKEEVMADIEELIKPISNFCGSEVDEHMLYIYAKGKAKNIDQSFFRLGRMTVLEVTKYI